MCFVKLPALLACLGLVTATSWATELDRIDSEDFLHVLEFDQDGVLPSAEAGASRPERIASSGTPIHQEKKSNGLPSLPSVLFLFWPSLPSVCRASLERK